MIEIYKIIFETRFCLLAHFTRKVRYGLYVGFQNNFRDVLIAWWIIWIMVLSYTKWLSDCHGVQMDYNMTLHRDRLLHPTGYWRVTDLWLVHLTEDWRVAGLWIVHTTGHDMIIARGLISTYYRILEGSRFLVIALYRILEGSGFPW